MAALREPAFDVARRAALAQWAAIVTAVDAVPDEAFERLTRLDGWRVAELVAHLGGNADWVLRCLAGPSPAKASNDWVSYYDAWRDGASAVDESARRRAAGLTPQQLRDRVGVQVREATTALADDGLAERVVDAHGPIRLASLLVTRSLEGVVHGLDLTEATGVPVEHDDEAVRLTVRSLAARLARLHPGQSLEVRIPGPQGTAVQCVAGPRHTRGTPPSTVEIRDPLTWVELATGRLDWAAVCADGRLHAKGSRSDLSGLLPVLA